MADDDNVRDLRAQGFFSAKIRAKNCLKRFVHTKKSLFDNVASKKVKKKNNQAYFAQSASAAKLCVKQIAKQINILVDLC